MQSRFDSILSALDSGRKLLLAVSGGVDSMVMATLFLNSSVEVGFEVAHCNFHLRGAESDSDEQLVSGWCSEHGIVLHRKDFRTCEYSDAKGVSIEMAARELRYAWFEELCRERGLGGVVVAHNANDNAETLVLNLLRGTGLKGITGMGMVSSVPVPGSSVRLLRPLLKFSRKDILDYAVSHGVVWHEDSTNADSSFKRNCVRNEVFPLFARINPSFVDSLSRDMDRFGQELAAADRLFELERSDVELVPGEDALLRVGIAALLESRDPEWLLYRLLSPYGFTQAAISSLLGLLRGGTPCTGKVFFSGTARAVVSGSEIIVTAIPSEDGTSSLTVSSAGEYSLAGVGFSVRTAAWCEGMPLVQPRGTIMVDAAKLPFPFSVRLWEDGDWMQPLGLKTAGGRMGRKKLSDLFVDLGYSLVDKEKALVAVPGGCESRSHVAALVGERIDESVKVTEKTASVIFIERKP